MSGVTGAVLAAIAAVFATLGFILFGKPKGTETSTRIPMEQVRPDPVEPPLPSSPVVDSQPLPIGDASVDPWVDQPPALTLETVEQSEGLNDHGLEDAAIAVAPSSTGQDESTEMPAAESVDAPITLNLDDATQVNELPINDWAIPVERRAPQASRYSSGDSLGVGSAATFQVEQAPFAVIQDPQRPASPELQTLSQKILAWGESGTPENLKIIMSYVPHRDAMIRRYVAVAIGQALGTGSIGADRLSALSALETLATDTDPKVQKMAVKSLKAIQT